MAEVAMCNSSGLYDMSGNVWQWCNDWYEEYSDTAKVDPTGPESANYRVQRGGSWLFMFGSWYVAGLRHSASRYGGYPGNWYNTRSWNTGFRCVR
jgi:formylglycine-generating enzyme required for sulfatase activity